MTILNFVYITKDGSPKQEWKLNENFHIFTKTTDNTGKTRDLVYLSGIVYFDYGTLDNEWIPDTVIIQFKDLRWFQAPHPAVQVAPVVSLGAISNIETNESETMGWGVNSVQAELVQPLPEAHYNVIQLKCNVAVRGLNTHLERLTYFVVAIGDIQKSP